MHKHKFDFNFNANIAIFLTRTCIKANTTLKLDKALQRNVCGKTLFSI